MKEDTRNAILEKMVRNDKIESVLSREEKKRDLIKYKGGKCAQCGLIAITTNQCVFDFHHLVKPTKRRSVNTREDADKCILLCANCHRMTHGPYGT